MLHCQLTCLSIHSCHLLNGTQTSYTVVASYSHFNLLSDKIQKFEGLRDIANLHHFEFIHNSSIHKCSCYSSLIFSIPSSEMPLEKIVDVAEPTIFQSVFLLFVPAVLNGTHQIISFLPFDHVVKDFTVVLPHEITYRQIAGSDHYIVLFCQFFLEEILLIFVLDLPHINKKHQLELRFKVYLLLLFSRLDGLNRLRFVLLLLQKRMHHRFDLQR